MLFHSGAVPRERMTADRQSCRLYAGTDDGLHALDRSPDGELERVASCLGGESIRAVAVHPATSGSVLAGGALRGRDVHDVVAAPTRPARLLVAAREGLFRSDDAGRSWARVDDAGERYAGQVLAAPDDPSRLYALVADAADGETVSLLSSSDAGATWTTVGGDLAPAGNAGAVAVHPGDGDVLFHAGDDGGDRNRVHASADGGRTWRPVGPDLPTVRTLAAAPYPSFG